MLGPLPVCCAKRTVATLFPLPPLPRLLPRVQFPALPPSPPCCYEPLVPPGESPAPTTALAPAPANCTVLGTGRYDEPLNLNDRRQEVDVLSPSHTSPTQRKRRRSQPSGQATVPEVLSPVELVVALTQGGQRLTSEQVASIIGAPLSPQLASASSSSASLPWSDAALIFQTGAAVSEGLGGGRMLCS